jgi:hypothetical protein
MKKQILTGLGVLLLGASMAVASPQSYRGNFNDQPQYRQQQQQPQQQYSRYSRREVQRQHHRISRAKHRKNPERRYNWRG